VDIVTDFDEWLTSDKTEQEIITFVEELCHAIGQLITGFEATCNALVEAQLPAIIDDLVNSNLDPLTVCTSGALMGSCP
jgi:ATP/maltotriose-dependent transcriptional regulator MalT